MQALIKRSKLADTLNDEKSLALCADMFLHNPAFNDPIQAATCYEMLTKRGPHLPYRYELSQYYSKNIDAKMDDPRSATLIQQLRGFNQPKLASDLLDVIKDYWQRKFSAKQFHRDIINKDIQADPLLNAYDAWLGSIKDVTILKACYKKLWRFYQNCGLETLGWKYCEKYLALINNRSEEMSAAEWKGIALLYDREVLSLAKGKYTLENILPMLRFIFNASKDNSGLTQLQAKSLSEALIGEVLKNISAEVVNPQNVKTYLGIYINLCLANPSLASDLIPHVNKMLPILPLNDDAFFISLTQSPLGDKISGRSFDRYVQNHGKHHRVLGNAIDAKEGNKELFQNFAAYQLLKSYRQRDMFPNVLHIKKIIERVHFAENELRDFISEADIGSPFVKLFLANEPLRSLLSEDDWTHINSKIKKVSPMNPVMQIKPQRITYEETRALIWYDDAKSDAKESAGTELVTFKDAKTEPMTGITGSPAAAASAAMIVASASPPSISPTRTPQTMWSRSKTVEDAKTKQANAASSTEMELSTFVPD